MGGGVGVLVSLCVWKGKWKEMKGKWKGNEREVKGKWKWREWKGSEREVKRNEREMKGN